MAWIEQVDYLQQLKSNVNNRQMAKEMPYMNTIKLH